MNTNREFPIGWLFVGFIVLVIALVYFDIKDTEERCNKLMSYTQTHQDTLQAVIACEEIKSGKSRDAAIIQSGGYRYR